MFCSNCGNQITDEARVCQRCGNPVSAADVPQPMQPADATPSMSREGGRSTTPLPVECPACGMLAFPGRSRCLICDADLRGAVSPVRELEQVSATEGTSEQKHQLVSVSEQTFEQESKSEPISEPAQQPE